MTLSLKQRNTIGARRLRKLGNALLDEVLIKKQYKFDMANWVGAGDDEAISGTCGTAGCAIGLCPKIFPKQAVYVKDNKHYPRVRFCEVNDYDTYGQAVEFFHLSDYQDSLNLFSPLRYHSNPYTLDHKVKRVPVRRVVNRLFRMADKLEVRTK